MNMDEVSKKAMAERNSLNHSSTQSMTRQYENILAEERL